jgi:ligand-binding sensor domain-containing protein
MNSNKITQNKTAVSFLVAGVLSLFLFIFFESIFQKQIGDEWLEIEPPFSSTDFDLAFDSNNQDWFCTRDGVTVLSEGEWHSYNQENSDFPGACNSIAINSNDKVWVGTNSGLMVFDGQSWQTMSKENSGLLSNEVCFINTDQNDRVWVSYCGQSDNRFPESCNNSSCSWCQDCIPGTISIFDGKEWSSIEVGGIHAKEIVFDNEGTAWIRDDLDLGGNKLHTIRNSEVEFDVLPGQEIIGLCVDGEGILKVITNQHSLYSFEGGSWFEQRDLGGHAINQAIACSQDGRVAFGFHHDLWIVKGDSMDHYTDKNSPKYYGLESLEFDHQGRLWIGEAWQTLVLSSEAKTPTPAWLVGIRDVTFHPSSILVFSLLLIGIGVAVWQEVVWITAPVIALGLFANALAGWQLRFLFGGTYIVLGVVGSLIGGNIRRRKGTGYGLVIALAIVGIIVGLMIDFGIMFMYYM